MARFPVCPRYVYFLTIYSVWLLIISCQQRTIILRCLWYLHIILQIHFWLSLWTSYIIIPKFLSNCVPRFAPANLRFSGCYPGILSGVSPKFNKISNNDPVFTLHLIKINITRPILNVFGKEQFILCLCNILVHLIDFVFIHLHMVILLLQFEILSFSFIW